jgi:hypothetical protein
VPRKELCKPIRRDVYCVFFFLKVEDKSKKITLYSGSLGSGVDEERS